MARTSRQSARRLVGACALALCAAAASLPAIAQQGTSEQDLLERLRRVREGIAAPAPQDAPAPALPAREDVQRRLAEQLGVEVEVLDMRAIQHDGRPALAVKVMNPGGDSNAAFMVTSLLVDPQDGAILGELRGPGSSAGPHFEPQVEGNSPAMRQQTYR